MSKLIRICILSFGTRILFPYILPHSSEYPLIWIENLVSEPPEISKLIRKTLRVLWSLAPLFREWIYHKSWNPISPIKFRAWNAISCFFWILKKGTCLFLHRGTEKILDSNIFYQDTGMLYLCKNASWLKKIDHNLMTT